MMISHVRCPRCGIDRTADLGTWGRFCFNCRLPIHRAPTAQPEATETYAFKPQELVRLERYRAAIRQGFYTDWPAEEQADRQAEVLSSNPAL
jgi:hypothetical protein